MPSNVRIASSTCRGRIKRRTGLLPENSTYDNDNLVLGNVYVTSAAGLGAHQSTWPWRNEMRFQ